MTRKDWTLLVIASAVGGPTSPVQLQKSLFLISRNTLAEQRRAADFYNFTPYDYGPFDSAVYADASALAQDGLVELLAPPSGYRQYAITPAGTSRAGLLRQELSENVSAYLDKVVAWVRSLSFNDLVRAIYEMYPEMKVNSVFRE